MTLVTTTIHIPYVLNDYAKDAKKHGFNDLSLIVVGDYKTPPETRQFCRELESKFGLKCIYLDVQDQKKFIQEYPLLDQIIPYNCMQRRNIGLLIAYLNQAEVIVTIDDDNFIRQKNYFGSHAIVGQSLSMPTYSSSDGWLNVCSFLKDRNSRKFYHRGHSLARRQGNEVVTKKEDQAKVVVNAGFWLGDPDIDAITRLATPIDVISYKLDHNFCLARDTYAPFNTQNTALHRSVIPAYFLAPFIGRFDDIWAGYFLKRIADHLGDRIAFGGPLVTHERTPHNLWDDLEAERLGLELSEMFCLQLRSIQLTGGDYYSCAVQLVEGLQSILQTEKFTLRNECAFYLWRFLKGYEGWLSIFATLQTPSRS
jgi:hypothetical protein